MPAVVPLPPRRLPHSRLNLSRNRSHPFSMESWLMFGPAMLQPESPPPYTDSSTTQDFVSARFAVRPIASWFGAARYDLSQTELPTSAR